MPVRSLSSAVFKWPDRDQVLSAARLWASTLRRTDPLVEWIACVGSYARNDWGVGSDVDVVVVIQETSLSPIERRRRYEPRDLPVPADVWVYTQAEWRALASHSPQLWSRLQRELLFLTEVKSA